jgi:hypothetical protein
LILVSFLSLLEAPDKQLVVFKVAQLIELFLIYFYLANHLNTKQDMTFFLTVLIAAMLVENILIITQWFTGLSFSLAGINAFYSQSTGRPGGTLGPAGVAGGINAALLIITLALVWLFNKKTQKVFAMICFIVGSCALLISSSRAAWGSFIISLLCFVFIGRWKSWIKRT